MGQVELSEKRQEDRFSVTGKVPGKLYDEYDKVIIFYPVDLSEKGLGIVLDREVSLGDQLKLKLDDCKDIFLRVSWITVHEEEDLFRCGLEAEDGKINFIELFDESEDLILENDE